MTKTASVSLWIEQLKQGNDDAGTQLWNRFISKLIDLARHKLRDVSKRTADEEDLVNSAFNAFLTGVRANRFPNLHSRNDLWQILVMLTERKAIDQIRRQNTQKRGSGKVRGESIFENADAFSVGHFGIDSAADSTPSPDFAAQFSDQVQYCMEKLDCDVLQRIVMLKLEGFTNKEVAENIGCSLSSIERKMRLIRQLWEK